MNALAADSKINCLLTKGAIIASISVDIFLLPKNPKDFLDADTSIG
jgi:hypothetical protein